MDRPGINLLGDPFILWLVFFPGIMGNRPKEYKLMAHPYNQFIRAGLLVMVPKPQPLTIELDKSYTLERTAPLNWIVFHKGKQLKGDYQSFEDARRATWRHKEEK